MPGEEYNWVDEGPAEPDFIQDEPGHSEPVIGSDPQSAFATKLRYTFGLPNADQQKLIIDARRDPRMKGLKAVSFFAYFTWTVPILITLALLGWLRSLGIDINLPIPMDWIIIAGIFIVSLSLFRIYLIENVRDFSPWAYKLAIGVSGLQILWGIFTALYGITTGGADIVVGGVFTSYLVARKATYMEWSRRIWSQ